MDAVNEYEGIAPIPCHAENKNQIIMALINFDGYLAGDLTTGDGVRNNEYWKVICTREEFNDLALQLETNFGESLSYKEYVSVQAMGASMVGKPPQPVFTQAMADNGELPQVGMECMILNANCSRPKYIKGLIKYVGDLVIYAYVENGERCDNVKTLKFKPIDTRTDKEKAIDDIQRILDCDQFMAENMFFSLSDIHGVKWACE